MPYPTERRHPARPDRSDAACRVTGLAWRSLAGPRGFFSSAASRSTKASTTCLPLSPPCPVTSRQSHPGRPVRRPAALRSRLDALARRAGGASCCALSIYPRRKWRAARRRRCRRAALPPGHHQRKRDTRAVPRKAADRAGPSRASRPSRPGRPPLRRKKSRRLSLLWTAWPVPTVRRWPPCRLLPAATRPGDLAGHRGKPWPRCLGAGRGRRLASAVGGSGYREVRYPGRHSVSGIPGT